MGAIFSITEKFKRHIWRVFSMLFCIFITGTLALETKEQMEASIEASKGVFEEWEYKLISLFEPKPLDLAFKYFLIQEAGAATATQFYDQLKSTNKLIRPDLVWYDENVNWLKHLVSSNGTEQKMFLKKMTQKQDLTVLTVDRLPGIDQTFDCWVILAFDSTEPMQSDLNLMDQILSHFNEKCQVGAIDLSFPSNRYVMRSVTTTGPSVIFRYPNSVMTDTKFHPQNWQINLRDISEWGDIIPPEGMISLGDDLLDYVESQVYTPMSDAQKIHAIYSPMDQDPRKTLMKQIIFEYDRKIQSNMEWFIDTLASDEQNPGEWDPKAVYDKLPEIQEYNRKLTSADSLVDYIESRLSNMTYMILNDYKIEQTTRLVPESGLQNQL